MIVLEPRQTTTDLPDAEALIKEARQRQRKRRIFVGIVVLVVALASGIWIASAGGTKAPSSSKKPGPVKSAGAAGLGSSRRANPLQLVGTWRVVATGEHPAPIVSVSGLGLLLWKSCGWLSGDWNANQQGLFVGILNGGVPACVLGTNSAADLNPRWLATATAYRGSGSDELLLGPNGGVLARLVPTTVPKVLRKGVLPAYLHPVVTPELRKVLLQANRPLPTGLVPAVERQLIGHWFSANPTVGHWPQTPYLAFTPNGNWSGSDGCNGLGGRWSLGSSGTLVVVSSPSTLIGCNNVDVGAWLSQATRAALQGRTLVLVSAAGKVTGRLRRG
jgi:heat shock protein HslJ